MPPLSLPDSPVRSQRGFTLVETVVVLAIIGVLAASSISLFNLQKTSQYDADVQEVLSKMRGVQSQAKVVNNNQEYGISFNGSTWTTFSIDPVTGVQTTTETKTLSNVTITPNLTPVASQVVFSRLSGQTKNATAGTITFALSNPARSKVIKVEAGGVLYVQ